MKDPIYKGIAAGLQVAFAKTEIVAWLTSKARSRKLNVRAFCGDYYFASDVPARMYRIARPVSQLSTPIIMRLPNKTKLVDLKLPTSSQIQITTVVVKPIMIAPIPQQNQCRTFPSLAAMFAVL
jgi:hypothetical protein